MHTTEDQKTLESMTAEEKLERTKWIFAKERGIILYEDDEIVFQKKWWFARNEMPYTEWL
jgi:hypothetical protein